MTWHKTEVLLQTLPAGNEGDHKEQNPHHVESSFEPATSQQVRGQLLHTITFITLNIRSYNIPLHTGTIFKLPYTSLYTRVPRGRR